MPVRNVQHCVGWLPAINGRKPAIGGAAETASRIAARNSVHRGASPASSPATWSPHSRTLRQPRPGAPAVRSHFYPSGTRDRRSGAILRPVPIPKCAWIAWKRASEPFPEAAAYRSLRDVAAPRLHDLGAAAPAGRSTDAPERLAPRDMGEAGFRDLCRDAGLRHPRPGARPEAVNRRSTRHRPAEARAPVRSSATPLRFSTETPATSPETTPAPVQAPPARPCPTERRTRARPSSSTPGSSTRPPPSRFRPTARPAPLRRAPPSTRSSRRTTPQTGVCTSPGGSPGSPPRPLRAAPGFDVQIGSRHPSASALVIRSTGLSRRDRSGRPSFSLLSGDYRTTTRG